MGVTARAVALVLFAAGVVAFVVYVWVSAPGIGGPEPQGPTTVPVSAAPAGGS